MESARCGIVSSVSEWDTTTIYQQIQAELANFKSDEEVAFANWFDYMKNQLTEDAAGRLQTEVDDVRGQIHTNLLNPTAQTQRINGVTFTNNGDGTYTVNGTASNVTYFPLADLFTDLDLSRQYKIVGCPQGGSVSSYSLYDDKNVSTSRDTGNGAVYKPTYQPKIYIHIKSGTTCNNLLFKPMLTTDLSADYDSFVKYSGSEERLNEQVASLHESSKGIITNLLNPTAQTQTIGGVSITNNGDGTYLINGTASADIWFALMDFTDFALLENKKLVGCPAGGTRSTYVMYISCNKGSTLLKEYWDYGNGVLISDIPSEATAARLIIIVRKGQTVNNLIFKPMLTTDLNATYDDYVRYSGDGRLNENVAALFDMFQTDKSTINSLIECTEAEITSLE
jgi:phage pi2 protein 07